MARITDSTLREGMQTRTGRFDAKQSVQLARLLVALGVDAIECGHPLIGAAEMDRVTSVCAVTGEVPVIAHARARREDVRAVARSGADWGGIFIGVNRESRLSRLGGRSPGEVEELIASSVCCAKDLGLGVRFTVEDGSRTEVEELLRAYGVAIAEGAERICLADTLGVLEPPVVAAYVAAVRNAFPAVELELHLHDDRGLAVANALAGLDAGASWISTSVNGLGERAGIVDLASMLLNLHQRGGRRLEGGELLKSASALVGEVSGSLPDDRRPLLGDHVFHHSARLHVRALDRDPRSYEAIDPALVKRVWTASVVERSQATEPFRNLSSISEKT